VKIEEYKNSQLKPLIDRQRNLVAAKEREIENVRNYFDAKKETERVSGQKEILDLKDVQQKEILEAVENKTNRLESMRTSLQSDMERLQKERELLSQQSSLDQEVSIDEARAKQVEMANLAQEKAKEIGQKANQQIADLQKDSQWEIAQSSVQARNKYDDNVRLHESTLADKMREQRVQLATQQIEHNQKLNQARSKYEKDVAQVTRSNVGEKNKREQLYLKELKSQEDQYNYLLREKRKQFEQKYSNLEAEHNTVLNRTEERFKQQLNELSQKYTSVRDVASEKKLDPFYHVQRLEHRLENTPEAYLIHLEVPEHEADSVLLSAHERKIKLTFSRRFSERVDGQNGQVDINKRSESFTQEFPVSEIVNSKEITRQYQDGVLTFKIKKA